MVERLHVLLYGETIGHLERASASEDPTFTYDSDYVAHRSVPLSAYLFGLLPESLAARSAWAGKLGTPPPPTAPSRCCPK